LTDIKVLRDIGYGTGKELLEFYKNVQDGTWSSKWKTGKGTLLFTDNYSNCRLMLDKIYRIYRRNRLESDFSRYSIFLFLCFISFWDY
jgi:hypothetical protein